MEVCYDEQVKDFKISEIKLAGSARPIPQTVLDDLKESIKTYRPLEPIAIRRTCSATGEPIYLLCDGLSTEVKCLIE